MSNCHENNATILHGSKSLFLILIVWSAIERRHFTRLCFNQTFDFMGMML